MALTRYTVLDAKAATGVGNSIDVADFDKVMIAFDTADSANLTVKFKGTIAETSPTFTSAQTTTNQWDTVEVIDVEDGAAIDGDTGIAPAGTDDHRMFQLNVDALTFITAEVTARSAGSVTVKMVAINHN